MKKRSHISNKYKWDLDDYYKSFEEWDNDLEKVQILALEIAEFEGKLNSSDNVYECLRKDSYLSQIMQQLYVFMALKQKEDANNDKVEAKLNKIESIFSDISTKLAFINSELNKLSSAKLLLYAKEPRFKNFELVLKEIVRLKKHILSKPEEKIIAQVSEFSGGFNDIFNMLDNADIKFEDVTNSKGKMFKLDHSKYMQYLEKPDRELRKNTMINLNAAYGKLNKTLSAMYISHLKKDAAYTKIRKFNSSLYSSIFFENACEEVYKTLIESVNKNLGTFHKYFEIKRKLLNIDKFAAYDAYVSPVKSLQVKFSYENAIILIKEALSVLGRDYINLIDKAVSQRWIDVYPNVGKETGAFAWGCYKKHPVVMMNFTDNINSVSTLAHELGHAMHFYLSNSHQCFENADYTIFVAEVASIVNELLLINHLIKRATSKKEKLYYLDYIFSMFRGTVLRQTMFAQFEQFAHSQYEDNKPISSKILNSYYYDLNKKYFGKKVIVPKELQYEWSRIPHFYNSYYVYKYATGIISATTIVSKLLKGENNAVNNYITFLSSGKTKPPVELIKLAGCDLTDSNTFKEVFSYLNSLLEMFENLV